MRRLPYHKAIGLWITRRASHTGLVLETFDRVLIKFKRKRDRDLPSFKVILTIMAQAVQAVASMARMRLPVFRHRYIYTYQGHLRLRYLCAFALICILAIVTISSGIEARLAQVSPQQIAAVEPVMTDTDQLADAQPEDLGNVVDALLSDLPVARQIVAVEKKTQWEEEISFASGDTIGALLNKRDVGMQDVHDLIRAMSPHIKPQDFKVGQVMKASFRRKGDVAVLDSLSLEINPIKTVTLTRDDEGYQASLQEVELVEEKRMARIHVASSLYADLRKQGVPDSIISRMIRAYAWSVDFQRDIWGGEEIELLYTVKASPDGRITRGNELLFANLTLRGKENPIYRFEHKDGRVDFYNPSGRSVKKALLRTPVDGARISSGYGMRRHPVLGYNKMHKGVDFAAPTGTPIFAAGDGVVEKKYRSKSYGNYIRIRHNDTFKTAYAHMHRFAKGMGEGKRVKQGQVIGYVGSTGRSTGPHLHYEVHKKGKQVNPRSVNLPIGDRLKGTDLANFKNAVLALQKQFARLDPKTPKSVASSE